MCVSSATVVATVIVTILAILTMHPFIIRHPVPTAVPAAARPGLRRRSAADHAQVGVEERGVGRGGGEGAGGSRCSARNTFMLAP